MRPRLGDRIGPRFRRQRGVEGRIEHGHLQHAGQLLLRSRERRQAGRVVKWGQLGKCRDPRADLGSDSHRRAELAAVDDAVCYSSQRGPIGQHNRLQVHHVMQSTPHRFRMPSPRHLLDVLFAISSEIAIAGRRATPLRQAACHGPALRWLHQRALQGYWNRR